MPSHAFIVSAHSRMNRMSSALSAKSLERASAALASSIFAATVDRVDLAIALASVSYFVARAAVPVQRHGRRAVVVVPARQWFGI